MSNVNVIPETTIKWVRTAADEKAVDLGFRFSTMRADRVRMFFAKFLRHSKGGWAGKPFELHDWQWEKVVAPLYGWYHPDDMLRRFREAYIQIAKKNGKSTLASGLVIYMLCADGEMGSEVYSNAADRPQAALVYNEAANMVERSSALAQRLRVLRSSHKIVDPATQSVYRVNSSEAATKEGVNAHCMINDEKHAWKGRALHDALKYATAAREQPIAITITTAGTDKLSVCYEEYVRAKAILSGTAKADIRFHAFVAEPGPGVDWRSVEAMRQANPEFGRVIRQEEMESCRDEAVALPTRENAYKRYRLNMWTEQEVRFLSGEAWDALAGDAPPEKDLEKSDCYFGMDLSSVLDLTALAGYWPEYSFVRLWIWCPAESPKRQDPDLKAALMAWAKLGHVIATPGKSVDYDSVKAVVLDCKKRYTKFKKLVTDRWNSTHLVGQIIAEIGEKYVEGFGQGYKDMTAPTKQLEKDLVEGTLLHEGNTCMAWMIRNLAVHEDPAGNLKPDKEQSREKIDGVVAMLMAKGASMVAPVKKKSVYSTRGVSTL